MCRQLLHNCRSSSGEKFLPFRAFAASVNAIVATTTQVQREVEWAAKGGNMWGERPRSPGPGRWSGSHVLPCFPIRILLLLHLLIFRHPYLTHMKFDFRIFLVLWIQHFIFFTYIISISTWRKKILPSNFEKIL
jgi:hypothetical protein